MAGLLADKASSFRAVFQPKFRDPASSPAAMLPFETNFETPDYAIALAYNEREMLTVSPDGQQFLLLSGDLYRPRSATIGLTLLDLYAHHGQGFVDDLNGSFSLILIDIRAGQILIATDRINSSKVLTRWDGDTLIVANSIYLQAARGLHINRAAVASYLSVGYIYNDGTLFDEIRTLDAATLYRLADGRLQPRRYWQYRFEPTADSPEQRQHDMADRLIEAVKIRLRDDRATYISLSGGYDSSAVLAILADTLHVPDVQAFTYSHGAALPGSDEYVAGQMAAACGYTHENIEAFDGDAAQTLRRNGQLGGAMIQVCDEVDAWLRLGKRVAGQPRPVLFTGDTPIVRHDMEIKAVADAVYSAGLGDFTSLDWSEKILGGPLYREFVAASQAEVERAVAHVGPTRDLYELRDSIYLEQYVSRRIGNWREYYAGRYFSVANPILDNDILELHRHTPTALRRGKRVYIDAVTAMFPKLYSIPLATTASYARYWPQAIAQQSDELRALVEGRDSPLDDMIAPDILLSLLVAGLKPKSLAHRLGTPAVLKLFHRIEHLAIGQPVFARVSHMGDKMTPRTFFLRALTLRNVAAEMTANA